MFFCFFLKTEKMTLDHVHTMKGLKLYKNKLKISTILDAILDHFW